MFCSKRLYVPTIGEYQVRKDDTVNMSEEVATFQAKGEY
jgi:hypothetical protein